MKPTLQQTKEKYTPQIMEFKGVEGVGIGEDKGKEYLVVYVSSINTQTKQELTKLLKDLPYRLEKIDSFKAF